jgi:23S rRNA (uracil1939-C5)-methyltransferase
MEVKIEKLVYGGEGLAHLDGATWFVPFVLPGETVAAQPAERRKKFIRARLISVLAPGAERATPPCPHFTVCGGCHYQHITYEAQLRFKTEILRETLGRLGGIQWADPIIAHPSPPLGYRNRAQWKVRPQSPEAGRLAIGYFRAGSSALCAIQECPILAPRLAAALGALNELFAQGQMPANLREIEVFADDASGKLLLNASLVNFGGSAAALAERLREALPGVESILLQETAGEQMELAGPGFIHYPAAGAEYRVGHLSFFQVNRFLIDEMVAAVAGSEEGRLALDLFAGVGLFTLALARRYERVIAVEANPAAAGDLKANIETAGVAAQPINAEAEQFLADAGEPPDLVVLDPPRAGLSGELLTRLAKLQPTRINYLSCDPATLARDLGRLLSAGYTISEVHLFDAFPETFHIESLVRLVRRP